MSLFWGKKSDSLYESRYSKVEKNVKFDIYIQSSCPKQILNVRRFQILIVIAKLTIKKLMLFYKT